MIIATWNVNSVRARVEHILKYLERQPVDVLCLQELKTQDADFPREPLEAAGYAVSIAGQKTYNGVAVLAREAPADPVVGFPHLPPDHPLNAHKRLLAASVGGVRVISAYLPNGEAVGTDKYSFKLAFFAELRTYLEVEVARHPKLCLVGDFNVAAEDKDIYDPEAWAGGVLCSEPERTALEALRAVGFVDCFRKHHAEGGLYSWWDYRGGAFWKNHGLRIDHVWATPELAATCTACEVDLSPRKWKKPSDHAPVRAVFGG
ncbi:MAG: exodeoxyribonuclease III [Deferrisomatales bacterium]|nr:exodeoxyribonuclease III [Deferrisomatales bacterium]